MKDENLYSFMNNFVNAAFDLSLGKMKKKNTKFKIIQKVSNQSWKFLTPQTFLRARAYFL